MYYYGSSVMLFGSAGFTRSASPGRFLRTAGVIALATFIPITAVPAQTDDDSPVSIEELRAEKRKVRTEKLENAKGIDVVNADIEDLNEALTTVRGWINSQQLVVAASRDQAASARAALDEAEAKVEAIADEIDLLGRQIRDDAVRTFLDGSPNEVLFRTGDPIAAIRQESLSRHLSGAKDDVRDRLDVARGDLVVGQQDVVVAARTAEDERLRAERDLSELEAGSAEYQDLLVTAEDRLEVLLTERQSLSEIDRSISSKLSAAEARLADLLGGAAIPGGGSVALVPSSDIRDAGYGVYVHRDIVANVAALLDAAHADGVNLAGGGYRDSADQIRLRRANCGSSDYAIFQMSASRCRPPTARPGRSMHEQGRAIDFTYNGRLITRRSGPGWAWLKANAASYGLFNLPSEPWHFSTNGR